MNKKQLTEADIRTKFITPALGGSSGAVKWTLMTQLREEVFFTKGRVIVRVKTVRRGEAKKADYMQALCCTVATPDHDGLTVREARARTGIAAADFFSRIRNADLARFTLGRWSASSIAWARASK